MNRRLRRTAAALFVVAAALFVVGVITENDGHSESGEAVHDETAEAAGPDEEAEASGHDEAAEESEAADGVGADEPVAAELESDDDESERVLGVDVESPAAVTAAVIVSLTLAVGLWLRSRRWLALVSVGFAVMFAVFDIAEIRHQLDEARTGLAVLAAIIAAAHLAAATTAGLSSRAAGPS